MNFTPRALTRFRPVAALATSLVIAASAGGLAQARVSHTVSMSAGKAAIQQFAQKVSRVTGAQSYQLSQCARSGSNVGCKVRWNYGIGGLFCDVKATAYYAGSALKVKRASGISCGANPL